jgi:membrane-bound metal-dependent hydrolase YbcI (DUF457 family)
MPLPLGHATVGLAIHDSCSKDKSPFGQWKVALSVAIIANLPDVDVVIGLLFQGNGNIFHRGPTHSLILALFMGLLASNAWKIWSQFPRLGFKTCFLVILSHLIGDFFFTPSPVSFFWPLEVHWSSGFSGWADVINSVFMRALEDAPIILGCAVVITLNRLIRGDAHRAGAIARILRFIARQTASRPN